MLDKLDIILANLKQILANAKNCGNRPYKQTTLDEKKKEVKSLYIEYERSILSLATSAKDSELGLKTSYKILGKWGQK